MELLWFYKNYGTARVTTASCGYNDTSSFMKRIYRIERNVADEIDELTVIFEDCFSAENRIAHFFLEDTVGGVDVFPIYVNRSKKRIIRGVTYNGKYKGFVIKVNAVSDNRMNVMWYSVHCGVAHDSKIWSTHRLPLGPHE